MFRAIARHPGSYVTAGVTIAAGIGAVVAMFSIYSAVVLNPTNVDRPHELVTIQTRNPRAVNVPTALSWIRFDNSLRHARSFSHIAAFDQTMGSERAMAAITIAFAAIALFMAMVGLYAVLAQSVAARTTEIGVRLVPSWRAANLDPIQALRRT